MPAVSAAQERLMQAAAHTKGGYGGVPQSVGKEFVGKDSFTFANSAIPAGLRKRAKDMQPTEFNKLKALIQKWMSEEEREPEHAEDADWQVGAAVVFTAPSGKVLLLKRSSTEGNYKGHWALPGGKADAGENAPQVADRECLEEIGRKPSGITLLNRVKTPLGFDFYTYETQADSEFVPRLNAEHTEFGWFPRGALPEPMHPAVAKALTPRSVAQDRCALDRKSVRSYDADKRLHVSRTPISKATVNEYYGREIPEYQSLGLDADTKYKLWRHPDELKKGATSFNNIPLQSRHLPMNPDDHNPDVVVGSLGTDAEFEHPYLYNSLVVNTRDAIDDVESERKSQLSSGYRYKADMTPGTTPEGERFDGIMRDLVGSHVALVTEGRAGEDVCVMDSKPKALNFTFARATYQF
jgi:8-oxo-dGTP pyrophosphatase MutT (NUDIX family)